MCVCVVVVVVVVVLFLCCFVFVWVFVFSFLKKTINVFSSFTFFHVGQKYIMIKLTKYTKSLLCFKFATQITRECFFSINHVYNLYDIKSVRVCDH